MKSTQSFILVLSMLIYCSHGMDWQGVGTFSSSNITEIEDYINKKFLKTWTKSNVVGNGNSLQYFVTGFSTHLNDLWDPAWNVVVAYNTKDGENIDTVLVGYAFRDHWYWFNGFKMNDNHYVGFIIWKDYNCFSWKTYNAAKSSATTYVDGGASISYIIDQQAPKNSYDDIWEAARSVAYTISTDYAVSVIFSQSNSVKFYAQVCVVNYLAKYDKVGLDSFSNPWGAGLVLEMRQTAG